MQVATVGYLLREDGGVIRTLLGKRNSLFFSDKWIGPGGKKKPNETILDCLLREVWEEVRVRINPKFARKIAIVDFHHPPDEYGKKEVWRVHFYVVTKWVGEPSLTKAFSKINWFNLNNLPYPDMTADQPEWLPTALKNDQPGKILVAQIFYGDSELKTIEKKSMEFIIPIRH